MTTYFLCECCNPIPREDKLFGTPHEHKEGELVHKLGGSCDNEERYSLSEVIPLSWGDLYGQSIQLNGLSCMSLRPRINQSVSLRYSIPNEVGSLACLTEAFAELGINVVYALMISSTNYSVSNKAPHVELILKLPLGCSISDIRERLSTIPIVQAEVDNKVNDYIDAETENDIVLAFFNTISKEAEFSSQKKETSRIIILGKDEPGVLATVARVVSSHQLNIIEALVTTYKVYAKAELKIEGTDLNNKMQSLSSSLLADISTERPIFSVYSVEEYGIENKLIA
ncbi:MAG: hypothetical protein ACFB16_03140 [Phormidesmis sp.]